jgi:hypothetical protein
MHMAAKATVRAVERLARTRVEALFPGSSRGLPMSGNIWEGLRQVLLREGERHRKVSPAV